MLRIGMARFLLLTNFRVTSEKETSLLLTLMQIDESIWSSTQAFLAIVECVSCNIRQLCRMVKSFEIERVVLIQRIFLRE